MVDRSSRVVLDAVVSTYQAKMAAAANTTRTVKQEMAALDLQNRKTQQSLETIGRSAAVTGAAMVAGFGFVTLAAARFEKSMDGVAAVSDASSVEMGKLSKAARDAGQATVFSASQAAQAEAELARAGVSTADILGGALPR